MMLLSDYTVVEGDTLGHIALRALGRANDWPKLYAINRRAIWMEQERRGIRDFGPDLIFPGTTLKLPVTPPAPSH